MNTQDELNHQMGASLISLHEEFNEMRREFNDHRVEERPVFEYVQMAIDREKKRKQFRDAVIEKSTVALIWAGLVWVGNALFEALLKLAQGAK